MFLLPSCGYHIDATMEGYLDSSGNRAASVCHKGMVVRTWIPELDIVYKGEGKGEEEGGDEHVLHLVDCEGKQKDRGHIYRMLTRSTPMLAPFRA